MANWSTEEDRLVRIEGADASLWDWQTSHQQPPVRQSSGSEWAGQVSAYYRHFKTHPTGTNVYFNMVQSSQGCVARGIVALGPDPPSSRDNAVWMAYYPEAANWRGSPFHTVVISNRALICAIEGPDHSGLYRLDPSLANKWADLEEFILPIVKTLRARVTLPYDLDLPDPPSRHGYRLSFQSSEQAFAAARKGRNTFHYLGAALAFLAAFWSYPGSTRPMHLLARWLSVYLKIDFERTAGLFSFPPISPNAGPSVVRRGMTISVRSPYVRYLPIFLDSNVPVIVELEGNFEVFNNSMLQMPNWSVIGPLMRGAVPYVSEGECCEACTARFVQLQEDAFTQSDPISLAIERDIEWLNHCSASRQSDTKLVHEQDVEKPWDSILCSTLRTYALYEWIGDRGVSMRRPVHSSQFYLLVKAYGLTSRYVSLLHHEIDFFPGIAEPQAPGPHIEHEQDPDTNHDLQLMHYPAQEALNASAEEGEIIEHISSTPAPAYYSDEEDEEPGVSSSAPLAPTHTPDTWKTLLHRRVGYTHGDNLPVPPFADPAHPVYPLDSEKGIKHALRFIGLTPDVWLPRMTEVEKSSCIYAARTLHDLSLRLYSIPVQFDMAAGDVLRSLDKWLVEKLVLSYEQADMHTKAVTTVVEHRYAIGIRSTPMVEQHYFVVVDAPALLEVARSACGGVVDIARTLTQKGIPCATAKYFPSTTQPVQRAKPREGQGVIQDRRNFSREAYLNYEMCRDHTFVGIKGSLALKEGGVVARLAREALPDIRPALTPPSRVAHKSGRVLGQNRHGLVAISDSLYPADLDAILGRYLNYKGPSLDQQEAATLWPSSSAWDASYLNTGAWNDEAEQWFTRQVQRWRTHIPLRTPDWQLQLKTSKEWKHTMRGTKGLRVTWKRYSDLANDYVSRRVP